jgi:hypothetical protein
MFKSVRITQLHKLVCSTLELAGTEKQRLHQVVVGVASPHSA